MSKVYFTDMRTSFTENLPKKLTRLIDRAGIGTIDFDHKFVAIKIHFGEMGNLAYLRPQYARALAAYIKERGGLPFLTDCNTLYVGSRKNALEHIETAYINGYTPYATGCQVIIADGVRGTDEAYIPIGCEEVKTETGGTRVESFSETARLFDWGFDNFADRTVLDENELICEVPVALSNEVSTVAVRPAYTAEAVLPKDLELEQLQRTVTCVDSVDAPVTTGDELGTITISYDGTDYVTVPLLAVADVSASRFLLARKAIGQFFSRTPVKIAAIVLVVLAIAVLVWFRLYGRTRRYGRASSKRYRQHTYRGRRR